MATKDIEGCWRLTRQLVTWAIATRLWKLGVALEQNGLPVYLEDNRNVTADDNCSPTPRSGK